MASSGGTSRPEGKTATQTTPGRNKRGSGGKSGPAGKPGQGKAAQGKAAQAKAAQAKGRKGGPGGPGGRTPVKPIKPGLPWGVIAIVTVIVLFAVVVIGYAVIQVNKTGNKAPSDASSSIKGVVSRSYPGAKHSTGTVKYDTSPPMGGVHDPTWADCSGTIYTKAIRNENAVHDLEHGAVWITYKPGLSASDLNVLKAMVAGKDHMVMSPYPGLDHVVSVQSWGHQLKVDSVNDKRIKQFIDAYLQNPKYTPEYGSSCSNPDFLKKPRTGP